MAFEKNLVALEGSMYAEGDLAADFAQSIGSKYNALVNHENIESCAHTPEKCLQLRHPEPFSKGRASPKIPERSFVKRNFSFDRPRASQRRLHSAGLPTSFVYNTDASNRGDESGALNTFETRTTSVSSWNGDFLSPYLEHKYLHKDSQVRRAPAFQLVAPPIYALFSMLLAIGIYDSGGALKIIGNSTLPIPSKDELSDQLAAYVIVSIVFSSLCYILLPHGCCLIVSTQARKN